jgi:hypothetical protein
MDIAMEKKRGTDIKKHMSELEKEAQPWIQISELPGPLLT